MDAIVIIRGRSLGAKKLGANKIYSQPSQAIGHGSYKLIKPIAPQYPYQNHARGSHTKVH